MYVYESIRVYFPFSLLINRVIAVNFVNIGSRTANKICKILDSFQSDTIVARDVT